MIPKSEIAADLAQIKLSQEILLEQVAASWGIHYAEFARFFIESNVEVSERSTFTANFF